MSKARTGLALLLSAPLYLFAPSHQVALEDSDQVAIIAAAIDALREELPDGRIAIDLTGEPGDTFQPASAHLAQAIADAVGAWVGDLDTIMQCEVSAEPPPDRPPPKPRCTFEGASVVVGPGRPSSQAPGRAALTVYWFWVGPTTQHLYIRGARVFLAKTSQGWEATRISLIYI